VLFVWLRFSSARCVPSRLGAVADDPQTREQLAHSRVDGAEAHLGSADGQRQDNHLLKDGEPNG
jgi:hypothetical protein